jgi:glycosyltransferase involved in cell wall biosynthesis
MEPLCSVVIPCYNSRDVIADTLEKILNQTYANIEIILVDDGSTDGTSEFVSKKFDLPSITIKNSGPAAARNVGIKTAKGKYVALCDADDHWYPEKIEKQVALLEENPDCGVCFTDVEVIRSGKIISAGIKERYIVYQGTVFEKLLFSNWITTSSVMIAVSVIRQHDVYFSTDREILNVEDWNYWIRLASHTQFVFLDEVTVTRFLLADSYGATHADKQFQRVFYNLKSILKDIGYSEVEIEKVLRRRTKYIGANRVFDDILGGRPDAAREKIDVLKANHCGGPTLALLKMSLGLPRIVVRAMHYWNNHRHDSEIRSKRGMTVTVSATDGTVR